MTKTHRRGRLLAALLLLTLLLSFTGCGDDGFYDPIEQTAPDNTVLARWGEYEITYDLFRFFFLNRLSDFDGGDRTLWRGPDGDALWAEASAAVWRDIADLYAAFEVAKEYGIDPFDENFDREVNTYIKADIDGAWVENEWVSGYGSPEAYVAGIEERFHATDAVLRLIYRNALTLSALYDYSVEKLGGGSLVVEDADLDAFLKSEDCVHYNHVFISNAGRGQAAARARAEVILTAMREASSYEDLIRVGFSKSSDIPDADTLENGMWASRYTLDRKISADYYDTLFSMEVGEISELIETDEGYYILYRMEKPRSLLHGPEYREDLLSLYLSHTYYLRIHTVTDTVLGALTYTDDWARATGVTFLDDTRA